MQLSFKKLTRQLSEFAKNIGTLPEFIVRQSFWALIAVCILGMLLAALALYLTTRITNEDTTTTVHVVEFRADQYTEIISLRNSLERDRDNAHTQSIRNAFRP